MEYKVGDKFIIEIEETYKTNVFDEDGEINTPDYLYRIKGFNSLVFDENGLDKLKKYDENNIKKYAAVGAYFLDLLERPLDFADSKEKAEKILSNIKNANYEKGLSDAWEFVKKICLNSEDGGMFICDVKDAFSSESLQDILKDFTPQEAIDKLKEWKKEQEIKAGDYITSSSGSIALVQFIDSWGRWECLSKKGQFILDDHQQQYWEKTEKHIDLSEIFKEFEDNND